jgi:hypothetical protein
MDWREAVEIVIERSRAGANFGHERYRQLCDDSHPQRELWQARMLRDAGAEVPPAQYPSAGRMAINLARAAGRIVTAAVQGEPIRVPAEVLEQRRSICLPCEANGLRESGGIKCTRCGCSGIKLTLATEECPVGKWPKWEKPKDGDRDDDRT